MTDLQKQHGLMKIEVQQTIQAVERAEQTLNLYDKDVDVEEHKKATTALKRAKTKSIKAMKKFEKFEKDHNLESTEEVKEDVVEEEEVKSDDKPSNEDEEVKEEDEEVKPSFTERIKKTSKKAVTFTGLVVVSTITLVAGVAAYVVLNPDKNADSSSSSEETVNDEI